jgi:hypothetical protein
MHVRRLPILWFVVRMARTAPAQLQVLEGKVVVMHACECLIPEGSDCVMCSLHFYVARHPDETVSKDKWIAKLHSLLVLTSI